MNSEEAFSMIMQALRKTLPNLSSEIAPETHLVKDKILDSLDSMNFLFELEQLRGEKIEAIDETFDDFRVSKLIELLIKG